MSRTTQYIGLTKDAHEYVKQATRVEEYEMTLGMFDEPVMGKIYHMPAPEGPNKELIAKEVVQTAPWSSGPMIFTHLKLILIKECGQELETDYAYSWVLNPEIIDEIDYERGHYYV